ncbi:MAG: divergent polysaccharide deacetylase family protein [Desulfobacterales bacterium]
MAKKKTRQQKKRKKNKPKKVGTLKTHLLKVIAGLSILILLVVAAGFLLHHLMLRKQPIEITQPPLKTRVLKIPDFEIFSEEGISPTKPKNKIKTPLPEEKPRIAIIIDDIGYDRIIAEKFLELDAVITFSILPHSPFQNTISRMAHSKGFESMLHLPMEPKEYPRIKPGPGALLISMSPDQLLNQLINDLDAVPYIKGVNNHMGSKMTENSDQLHQIFSVLKQRGLFFIDSRTTSKSLCKPSARLLQTPFAQRDVFIDHIPEPDFIRKQIKLLIRIANKKGIAVGIAHPHIETYEVFREVLPELNKKVRLVPASEIVHPIS